MKIDDFRKTWITNFPESELEKYQHAVDVQGDPLLVIWSEAYGVDDSLMDGHYSLHYSGREFLDDFWNTLLEIKVTIKQKKESPKKKRTSRKKKVTPKKKITAKHKQASANENALLVEF